MHAHDWPGNVRQLENCLEAAIVLAPGPRINPEHLRIGGAPSLARASQSGAQAALDPDVFYCDVKPLRDVERAYVAHVLARHGGNRSAAARDRSCSM